MPSMRAEETTIFPYRVHLQNTDTRPTLHTHDFHEFFLLFQGNGWQLTDAEDQPMQRNDFFLFPAGSAHIGYPRHPETYALIINVPRHAFPGDDPSSQELRDILHALIRWCQPGENHITLAKTASRRLRTLGKQILKEQIEKAPGYHIAVYSTLQEMLLLILRHAEIPPHLLKKARSGDAIVRLGDVLHYIETCFADPITVEQMATMAHMSRSHFHKVFRESTGQPLLDYINDRRIRESVRLLQESTLPIIQIASACGFPCLSHFYAEFKRRIALTPRELRQQSNPPPAHGRTESR